MTLLPLNFVVVDMRHTLRPTIEVVTTFANLAVRNGALIKVLSTRKLADL